MSDFFVRSSEHVGEVETVPDIGLYRTLSVSHEPL